MKSVATKPEPRKTAPPQASPAKKRSVRSPDAAPAGGTAPVQTEPAHEQIVREAAYFIYERSGRVNGRELENWLRAEAEITQQPDAAARRAGHPADPVRIVWFRGAPNTHLHKIGPIRDECRI